MPFSHFPHCAHVCTVFEAIWQHSFHGMAFLDKQGKFIRANPAWASLVGYSESELLGRTWQSITHPDDLDGDQQMADGVKHGEVATYDMEKRYISKSGRVVWIRLRVVPIQEPDGDFSFFFSQVAALAPPAAGSSLPTRRHAIADPGKWIKANWTWLIVVLGAVAVIIAEVIRRLNG